MRSVSIAVLLAAACGGASDGASGDSPGFAERREARAPSLRVSVDVRVTRVGSAVRLDIDAIARNAPERAAFEDPDRWTISARQGSRRLQRLVNGSVEIERREGDTPAQWDTVVRFNLVYQVEEGGGALVLELEPPGGKPYARTFAVADIPEETPEEGSGVEAAAAVDAQLVAEREAEAKAKAEEEARLKAEEEARLKAERKRKKKRKKKSD